VKLKNVVVAGAALGLVAAVGCSKGSGQKFTPVGGGVATGTGALTSALPTPNRASSYSFDSYQLNSFSGNGRVTAMTAAPVGSQVVASHAPGSTAALIANGSAADEQAVSFYEAGSMASIESGAAFLATSDVEGTDAGQVFVRNGTTWNISLNPGLSEASVSKIGSQIYAFAGQEGVPGRVFLYSETSGTFSEIAAVNSSIPQRGAQLNGTVYVGGMNNTPNGGGAQLYRLNGSTLDEVTLPAGLAAANGQGVRQEITDMLTVTYGTVSGGAATTGSATPATLGYNQDIAALVAQDCGSCHAITGIVGTAMLLNSAAATTDYTTILAEVDTANPAGSSLLLKASGGTSHTGGAPWATTSTAYATVLQWITEGAIENGSAGSSGGSSTGGAVSGQLIFLTVGAFARDGGAATGGTLLAYNGQDFEVMASYGQDAPTSLAWIDDTLYVGTAAGTLSYRDANGQLVAETDLPANTGVLALLARDGNTLAIGAKTNDGGFVYLRTPGAAAPAPTPQPSPQPTPSALSYASDVAPLLEVSCGACHSNTALVGTAMLFTDNTAANDYAVVLTQVNMADAANSNLLLKASNTVTHTGGGPWAVGSAQHTTVMTWIQGGAQQ
jgi:hypothetical protein